jgi:hypothetical protein
MGHILFVIYESGGTLTYLKYSIFQSLNLEVNVGLFYSSLILNDGAVKCKEKLFLCLTS